MRSLFIFFGPPACGKGTLAQRCKTESNYITLSTGDLLRHNVAQGTELGKQAKAFMDKGDLVPDSLVSAMVKEWLTQQTANNNPIVLDGYPRTKAQAASLFDMLKDPALASLKMRVIRFTVPEAEVVSRISSRVVCSNKACQKVYSLKAHPPKVAGICDICGSKLIQRPDDTEPVIKKRYQDYMKTENEILDFYRSNNVSINEISANQPMDAVYAEFKKIA